MNKMKTLSFIILFLLIGAFFIISENKIQINNTNNIDTFLSLYANWLSTLLDNTKTVTGYVVKMGWLPEPSP
tara:strand:- start:335 stop:550 length:216 start_codon:yes stop_codon:yes gene_type:complete